VRYISNQMVSEYEADTELFDDAHVLLVGTFKSRELVPDEYTLEDSVACLEGKEKKLFIEFARKMLHWLPEDRKTAKELLEDPWIRF
jgi:serine/threonine protein kinase